jgi:glycosyltransferase involved in cell wall biosynthesis
MITVRNKHRVLLIDPTASDRGHHLEDDLFLTECIAPLTSDFEIVTSPVSVANLTRKLHVKAREIKAFNARALFPRLRLLRVMLSLRCSRFGQIVFQSFEEISTLLFMLLHSRKRVHLIVTNNLRPDRVKRHPILGPLLLRAVFQRAATVVVGCQYSVDNVKAIAPDIDPGKILVLAYHKIGQDRVRLSSHEKKPVILFVGPERAHKQVKPVIDLIKKDRERRYRYVFCSMDDAISEQDRSFLQAQENVELGFGYMADEKYYRLYSEAMLILMTHDTDFEGTLSGVFCDAVASGTPVIARDMAPHSEFFERFGPMGFLVDYADPGWCRDFLGANLQEVYPQFQKNMERCREASSMEAIREQFRKMLAGC